MLSVKDVRILEDRNKLFRYIDVVIGALGESVMGSFTACILNLIQQNHASFVNMIAP